MTTPRQRQESEPLLTPSEVATLFRVDPKTVTRWAKAGKLTSIRTLGGHRRYRESEVRSLLEGNTNLTVTSERSIPHTAAAGTDHPEPVDRSSPRPAGSDVPPGIVVATRQRPSPACTRVAAFVVPGAARREPRDSSVTSSLTSVGRCRTAENGVASIGAFSCMCHATQLLSRTEPAAPGGPPREASLLDASLLDRPVRRRVHARGAAARHGAPRSATSPTSLGLTMHALQRARHQLLARGGDGVTDWNTRVVLAKIVMSGPKRVSELADADVDRRLDREPAGRRDGQGRAAGAAGGPGRRTREPAGRHRPRPGRHGPLPRRPHPRTHRLLESWSPEDCTTLARLLERFTTDLQHHTVADTIEPRGSTPHPRSSDEYRHRTTRDPRGDAAAEQKSTPRASPTADHDASWSACCSACSSRRWTRRSSRPPSAPSVTTCTGCRPRPGSPPRS